MAQRKNLKMNNKTKCIFKIIFIYIPSNTFPINFFQIGLIMTQEESQVQPKKERKKRAGKDFSRKYFSLLSLRVSQIFQELHDFCENKKKFQKTNHDDQSFEKVYDHFSFMKDNPLKKIAPRKLNPYQKYIQQRFKDQSPLPEKQKCTELIFSYVDDWKKMSKEERQKFASQQIEQANNQDPTINPDHSKKSPKRLLKGIVQRS